MAPCSVGTSGEIDSAILSTNTSPIRSTPHADKTAEGIRDAGASTTTASSAPGCRASMSLVNSDEKLIANCSAKSKSLRDRRPPTTAMTPTTTTRDKTNDPHDINADDDEEIDVVRVDDRDPMWRPW